MRGNACEYPWAHTWRSESHCRSHFFLSTTWVPQLKLGSPGSAHGLVSEKTLQPKARKEEMVSSLTLPGHPPSTTG